MHWFNEDEGIVVNYEGIYRTLNGGETWEEMVADRLSRISFSDTGHGAASGYFYPWFYETFDGGATWERVDYPWTGSPYDITVTDTGVLVCGEGSVILETARSEPVPAMSLAGAVLLLAFMGVFIRRMNGIRR